MLKSNDFDSLPKIIAVDFDGTLVEDNYPEIGKINEEMFDLMIKMREKGVKLVLWTSRNLLKGRDLLEEAVEFCKDNGLEFDAINENIEEVQELTGEDTRKVYADVYLDDKSIPAIMSPLYWCDLVGLNWMEDLSPLKTR